MASHDDQLAERVSATRPDEPLRAEQMHARLQERMFRRAQTPIKIDRFVVIEELGEGAMGVVFAAFDPQLDRKVALKLLRGSADASSRSGTEARSRLVREAKALARLSHPNVVTVYEVGEYSDRTFLAMEFVDGSNLRQWLASADADWRGRLDVMLAAGEGLAAAHRAGLVHRDFKPDNVLVGRDGRPRVADFGLVRTGMTEEPAREAASSTRSGSIESPSRTTRTGDVVGTPAYMSPEQRDGATLDARADQFSFCVTLHEVLRGHRPREGESDGRTPWPRRLDAAIRRGLQPDAAARFDTMDDLLDELRRSRGPRTVGRWVALVAGTGAVAAAIAASSASGAACLSGEAMWSEVWSEPQRKGLADAMERAAPDFAATSAEGAARELDRFGARWIAARDRACAEQGSASTSPALLELELRCLEQRLDEARALLVVLEAGTPRSVANAVAAVQQLPDPATCSEVDRLARQQVPAARRAEADAATQRLTQAAALQWAGQPEQARPALLEILESPAADLAIVAASAGRQLGAVEAALGNIEEARSAFVEAFAAAEGSGDPRLRAELALAIAHHIGYRESDDVVGLEWLSIADAVIAQLEHPGALGIRRDKAHGAILYAAGRYTDSAAAHEKALHTIEARDPGDDVTIAVQQVSLAGALTELRRVDEAVELLRDALSRLEAASVADARVANAHNTLANALVARGEYEPAATEAQTAIALFEATRPPGHPDLAMAHNNLAVARASAGTFIEAVTHFERALAIWSKSLGPDHPRVGTALGNLSLALFMLKRWDDAVTEADRAIALQTRVLRADHPDLALLHTTRARSLKELARFDEALESLEIAQGIVARSLGETNEQMASVLLERGLVLLSAKRPGEALAGLQRSCGLLESHGASNVMQGDCAFALGRAQWLAGPDREVARASLRRAEQLFAVAEGSWASVRTDTVREWLDAQVSRD